MLDPKCVLWDIIALEQIVPFKFEYPKEPVSKYFMKYKEYVKSYEEYGEELSEKIKCNYVLLDMLKAFDSVWTAISNLPDYPYNKLKERILNEEAHLKEKKAENRKKYWLSFPPY